MKLVAIWGSAVVLVAAAFASCSVSHRSGDFTWERSAADTAAHLSAVAGR